MAGFFDEEDPMPLVNKTPTPVSQINPAPAQSASKWDKVKSAISGAASTAASNLMPDTPGLQGLLSSEDFAASRKQGLVDLGLSLLGDNDPNFGSALSRGLGAARSGYADRNANTLHNKALGDAEAKQKAMLASRAAIAKQYGQAPPGETPEQAIQRLLPMMAAYTAAGDTEMMGKIEPVVRQLSINSNKAPKMMAVPEGGTVIDPSTGREIFHAPKTPSASAASDHFSAVPGIDPTTGKPTVFTFNTKTGEMKSSGVAKPGAAGGSGALSGPIAAKVGQYGEMLKKASDLLPQMDALEVALVPSAAQDVAEHGVKIFGTHIPGTQGVGSLMLNRSPAYAKYQAGLSPFILAAAHALSGARINADQTEQIRHSIEFKPGDSPTVRAQKRKNMVDLVNSIGGALPPDAVADQENQMEPTALTALHGYGYRSKSTAKAESSGGGAKPALTQAQYDAGIAAGHKPAEIAAHYDVSKVKTK